MANELFRIKAYFKYFSKAVNRHGIHSPFVYKLADECIYNKTGNPKYSIAEDIRKKLLLDQTRIKQTDFGAGLEQAGTCSRTIASIAKNSAKRNKYGRLLHRLVNYFQPYFAIELGSSLGISSIYQATASPLMRLHTIEGCPETSKIAMQNFEKAGLTNIMQHCGNFDLILPDVLNQIPRIDYAFFDGNHKKEPTLKYFEQCLPFKHNDSVFIFDDIHWSPDMEEAWEEIKKHPDVTVTIDMFELGLVFFRKELTPEHFIIKY